jgi:hypothetical protein
VQSRGQSNDKQRKELVMKESITQKLDMNFAEAKRGVRSGLDSASDIQDQKLKNEGEKNEEETLLFLIGKVGNQGNAQD